MKDLFWRHVSSDEGRKSRWAPVWLPKYLCRVCLCVSLSLSLTLCVYVCVCVFFVRGAGNRKYITAITKKEICREP